MNKTKEHILKTAYLLFLQKSFKAVTMKEIVEETGLSKGAFYHYFSSKEEVFEEVVDQYFMKLMNIDYDRFSQDSLKEFYEDTLKFFDQYLEIMDESGALKESLNFYLLIFEALRIIPNFKKNILDLHEKELKAWTNIIRIAKQKGEIKTSMADEAIAKLFIYGNDGAGVRLFLNNDPEEIKEEILSTYSSLYELLKA